MPRQSTNKQRLAILSKDYWAKRKREEIQEVQEDTNLENNNNIEMFDINNLYIETPGVMTQTDEKLRKTALKSYILRDKRLNLLVALLALLRSGVAGFIRERIITVFIFIILRFYGVN